MVVRAGDDGRFLVLCFFKFTLSHVWLFVIPRTVARKAPQSTEFPRQEYWSGLPFPSPGDLPDPGIEASSLTSPALAGGFLTHEPPGKPQEIAKIGRKGHLFDTKVSALISKLYRPIGYCFYPSTTYAFHRTLANQLITDILSIMNSVTSSKIKMKY